MGTESSLLLYCFGITLCTAASNLYRMFYRGHMKYLREHESAPAETAPTLLPPDEFKTRRQLRHIKKTGPSGDPAKNFLIKFQKKDDEGHHGHGHGAARFKKSAHIIQDHIMLEHFSSNHEKDWTQTVEAGVLIWVNKGTGEVSTIRPWGDSTPKFSSAAQISRLHPQLEKSNDILRRIAMLKDQDSDHKASPRAPGQHSTAKSPRSALNTARPSTTPSPRAYTRPSEAKGEPFRHEAEAKTDHHHHAPEGKNGPLDENASYDDDLHDAEDVDPHELGTGSLVYDRSEVDNFFALLDGMK